MLQQLIKLMLIMKQQTSWKMYLAFLSLIVATYGQSCANLTTAEDCALCDAGPTYFSNNLCSLCSQATTNADCSLCQGHVLAGSTCSICQGLDNTTLCSLCADYFFDSDQSTCTICSSANKTICQTTCKTNYFYDSVNLMCIANFSNCGDPYYIYNQSDCQICNYSWQYNYYQDQYFCGYCSISNCQTCSYDYYWGQIYCSKCATGYTLSYGYCIKSLCTIKNCKICSGSLCYQCNYGYSANSSQTGCTKSSCNIANCQQCSSALTTCLWCSFGYILSSNSLTCDLFCVDNCKTCQDTYTCSTCQSGYALMNFGSLCSPNCFIANCHICESSTTCEKCKTGFQIGAFGRQCTVGCNDGNCQVCSAGVCQKCYYYYQLINNICQWSQCFIQQCKICRDEQTCQSCYSGYVLSADQTQCLVSCSIPNCQICKNSSHCLTCKYGSVLSKSSTFCQSVCSIQNCYFCLTSTKCGICDKGYSASQTGKCQLSCEISNCKICNSDMTCAACNDGFQLGYYKYSCLSTCGWNQIFVNKSCSSCSKLINSCIYCQSSTSNKVICNLCSQSSLLLNNICVNCSSLIPNCYFCSSPITCQLCKDDYRLNQQKSSCLQINILCEIPNCKQCTQSACSICQQGYDVSKDRTACNQFVLQKNCSGNLVSTGDKCICPVQTYRTGDSCSPCPTACLTCTASTCLTCAQSFYLEINQCIACNINCMVCISSSICTQCSWGYANIGGKCRYEDSQINLILSSTGSVTNCPANCQQCSVGRSNKNVCTKTSIGWSFNLKGEIVQCKSICKFCSAADAAICTSCYNSFRLVDGDCQPCFDSNCIDCSTNQNICINCGPGFTANQGKCEACTDNCLTCNIKGPGKCDSSAACEENYIQVNGQTDCIKCIDGCTLCNPANIKLCLKCNQGYYKSNQTCLPCSTGCIKCDSQIVCQTCHSAYLNVSGQCVLRPTFPCTKADSKGCSKCVQRYKLSSSFSCQIDFSCNNNNSCTSCPISTYLKQSKCLQCPIIDNCLQCFENGTGCATCVKGYFTDGKSCTKCLQGCGSCQNEYYCNSPNDGFFIKYSNGNSIGTVQACAEICKTCQKSALNCLSCHDGYQIQGGGDCLKIQYIEVVLNLKPIMPDYSQNLTAAEKDKLILKNWNHLQQLLKDICSKSTLSEIYVKQYNNGQNDSIVVKAFASPKPTQSTISNFNKINNNIGFKTNPAFKIISSSVQIKKTKTSLTTSSQTIFGLIIGLVLYVLIAV